MGYEYITKYDSPNFTRGREGNKPQYIVIHHWGQDGASFWGVVNWLCRRGGNSSAHYVVEAGRVACIVDPDDTAWHAGNWWYNLRSIGIECRPEMSAGDFATVAELIRELWRVYGKLPLIGHKDIVSTSCPGRYYAKLSTLKSMAESGNISAPPHTGGWKRNATGWWWEDKNGTYPTNSWKKISGIWYYFNAKGYAVTGWNKIDGKWYYFNSDCKMQMGWQKYQDTWYYLDEKNGGMVSDEFRKVNGAWYKFDKGGKMLADTKLTVEPSGAIR